MAEIIEGRDQPFEEFQREHIHPLGEGGIAFHAQVFPGMYPPDIALHERAKRLRPGERVLFETAYYAGRRKMHEHGVAVQRLRVLPQLGELATKDDDLRAHIRLGASVHQPERLEDVRFIWHKVVERELQRAQLPDSPWLNAYSGSVGQAGSLPQGSLWAAMAPAAAGGYDLRAIRYMFYEQDATQKAGYAFRTRLHVSPFNTAEQAYVYFWHGVFRDEQSSFGVEAALGLRLGNGL